MSCLGSRKSIKEQNHTELRYHKGAEMDETTFFEYGTVRVTNSRFIVDGQTFAMSNITSVKAHEEVPGRTLPILLIILAVILVLNAVYWGLVLGFFAMVWLAKQQTAYHVMLHTSGGETSALKTYQKEYLQSVVNALNDAIVHRG